MLLTVRPLCALCAAASLAFAATACGTSVDPAVSSSVPPTSSPSPSSASTTAPTTTTPTTTTPPAETVRPEVPVEQCRAAAASLLMPGVTNYDDALAKLQAGVGGIFLTSWADPELLTTPGRDIAALRAAVGRPFDVSIDFEGGRVQRFAEILGSYSSPAEIVASGSPEQVEETAFQIGQSLAAHGITVDFAPVLDVSGGGLGVVGDRAFSTDPAASGQYGAAFARGLERAGVEPVFKHYPGHGRASGDTHQGAAVTPPLGDLFGWDLVPYDIALPAVPRAGVMVGHLVVPGLGDGVTPASLNSHAYGLLRNHHLFTGVAYTDDLTGMRAITDNYTPEMAVVAAVAAGADQALWSTAVDVYAVIDAVEAAVADGTIHPQRFAAAVERVRGELGE